MSRIEAAQLRRLIELSRCRDMDIVNYGTWKNPDPVKQERYIKEAEDARRALDDYINRLTEVENAESSR